MRQCLWSAFAQIMACRLLGTKSLCKPSEPSGTHLSEILIKIQNFSFTKMHLEITSAKMAAILSGEMSKSTKTFVGNSCKCIQISLFWWCQNPTTMDMYSLLVPCRETNMAFHISLRWLQQKDDIWLVLLSWWRHQMETFPALLVISAGNSPVPVTSPHKGQWRGALMFSLICIWINVWVNNREAGDLRRYRVHYDVIVMLCF